MIRHRFAKDLVLILGFQVIQLNKADTKESKKVAHADAPDEEEL